MANTDSVQRVAATTADGSSRRFPRLTWVTCECGCGWEGEDEVTQWLVEEAVQIKIRALQVGRSPEQQQADELRSRHAEMLGLRDRLRAG